MEVNYMSKICNSKSKTRDVSTSRVSSADKDLWGQNVPGFYSSCCKFCSYNWVPFIYWRNNESLQHQILNCLNYSIKSTFAQSQSLLLSLMGNWGVAKMSYDPGWSIPRCVVTNLCTQFWSVVVVLYCFPGRPQLTLIKMESSLKAT